MAQNYFHSNVSGKDEISHTCSSFYIPTNSYAIFYLRYNKPGRSLWRPVVWVFNVRSIGVQFLSLYFSKIFSKNEKALRNIHIWKQKGQK